MDSSEACDRSLDKNMAQKQVQKKHFCFSKSLWERFVAGIQTIDDRIDYFIRQMFQLFCYSNKVVYFIVPIKIITLMMMQKPVKSLSARNFFKMAIKDRQQRKKGNTLHTQPVQTLTPVKRVATSRTDLKNNRSQTMRIRENSFHPPEELQEENMKLKSKVNRLTEELTRQKVKRTQDTRHLTKMQKQVEVQFQDDKYLDVSRNHNKLIEGVKHQYHKMKQMYEAKCKQYNQLLKRYQVSGGEQSRFECDSLHLQNQKLRQKLEILLATEERIAQDYQNEKNAKVIEMNESISKSKVTENQILDILGISSQFLLLSKKIQNLQQANNKFERKIQKLRRLVEQKSHKINFLDKLLIQKSNQNHHLVMKQRKTSRQNKGLFQSLEEVRLRLDQESEARRLDLEYLREKERVKFETQKAIFVQSLQQKDQQIDKLREELKYVSTLIQYLKMGDENINMESSFNPLKKTQNKRSQGYIRDLEVSLSSLKNPNEAVRERVKTLFESNLRDLHESSRGMREFPSPKAHANTETLKKLNMSDEEDMVISVKGSDISQNNQEVINSRVVKKSHLKHHNDMQRVKPIKIEQLESFRLDLMYRFIYYGIGTDEAKGLLDYRKEEGVSKREAKWRSRYISMKEAKRLMMEHPFLLTEHQATFLARYVVEDATKDDVFYHQENEIERSIAKSILRAFVGEYCLPDPARSREEIQEMLLTNSGKNLHSALSSLAPSGTISWVKMMEICRGIQVEFTDRTWNFIFSQLCHRSPGGINKLNYDLLFDSL